MKEIAYNINTNTGCMTLVDSKQGTRIEELENNATKLVFKFDKPIIDTDKLIILVKNSKVSKPYKLIKKGNKYEFELPREMLVNGRLSFDINHYNDAFLSLNKYAPESYLYVTKGLDITNDMIESRPDLFAELFYRIEKLEKEIKTFKKG